MNAQPDSLAIGAQAAEFTLPGVDGKTYRLGDFDAPVFVYVQGCNHCPYVLAYLERIKQVAADYGDDVQMVMVNSNDAERYPDDSFENMRAMATEQKFGFPYLHDESQETARAYKTSRTPEVLVFDRHRKLAYHGRIDDNVKEPDKAEKHEFRDALDALLAGRKVAEPETYAVGCSLKWKPGKEPQ